MTVKDLLEVARVSRYEGIPFILDEGTNQNYQRFLIEQKLANISGHFILNDHRKTFPNTITIVWSEDCEERTIRGVQKLTIPRLYSSINIIDGQHRLYAYTKNGISERVRERAEILASAIMFRRRDRNEVTRFSAKVFCEINSNQAKVKNNLIYLIKYDVLGDRDDIAIAGKILLQANKGNSALSDIFHVNTLRKKNRLNLQAVPLTTIIDSDLIPFIKGIREGNQVVDTHTFRRVFGNTREHFLNNRHEDLVRSGKAILERYFNWVREIFQFDWVENSSSHIISAKYISALIRFLRYKVFVEGLTIANMRLELEELKEAVDELTEPDESPSFPKENQLIPSTRHGIKTIFEFFLNPNSYEITD